MGICDEGLPMRAKKPTTANKKTTVVANDSKHWRGKLKPIGGSRSDHWNSRIANDTALALWIADADDTIRHEKYEAAIAGLMGIAPKDELEGMMAAQLIAAHGAAMECYRRAMLGEQTFEGRRENLSQANKLSRCRP
jgi:hypothetical protein